MARLRLHAARALALAGLLVAGVGVSAAVASPGQPGGGNTSTVPGSPGDDCSHGKSDKDCKPDPQPDNGKDCQDHGNARGNEDHCADASSTTTSTPTSTTTSTSETTSTETSTTVPTTSTTSNPPTTTGGSSSTTTTATANGPTSPPTTSTSETAGASAPPTKAGLEKELEKQVKGVSTTPSAGPTNTGELPFTGFPAWLLALLGSAMVAVGLGLRKAASRA
jgi:hypothetical protein